MKKKFSINDMSVKGKITMFSAVALIFMVIIAGTGIYASNSINKQRQARYNNFAMGQYYLSEAFTNFNEMKAVVRNQFLRFYAPGVERVYDDGIKNFQKYQAAMEENFALFEQVMPAYDNKEINDNYTAMRDTLNEWIENSNSIVDEIVAAGDDADAVDEAATQLMTTGVSLADQARDKLQVICNEVQSLSDANGVAVERELQLLETLVIVVAIIAVIIIFAYAVMLIKMITVPVAKLSEAAKKMAVGDVDVDVTKIHNDDLGDLMDAFDDMAAAIREQVRIADLVASGDFTVEVQPRSEKDVLGKALQKLVADENITLNNIKEAGAQITVGSEQVANASQALAQGSTEQASALQQVTASMDEVTQRTKANATEAGQANTLVNSIKEMAAEGNDQMKSMIQAMQDINESSETISKIIKTIDDISFQTNILALNAAVEAARAGIHGKGFAVVAEEVRNLASKSAAAAAETAGMIEDSIRKVANGSKLAEETAKSLDAIVNSIDEIVGLISNITVASNDQATAISQIDQAISQVSTVVQTNAATSEQCAAASEELSNQAVTLRNLIGQYKLLTSNGGAGSYSESSSYSNNDPVISLDGDMGKY